MEGISLKQMFSHALVTGGAGFIGSHLTRTLLDRGLEVTVLDNLSVGTCSAVDSRARFIKGDVRFTNDVVNALQGVNCVFHLAAKVTIRRSFDAFYDDVDTNLMGTINLLRCLDADSISKFILASSMAVYADALTAEPIPESHHREPISPYGVSKLASELVCSQVLRQLGIPFSALRYFNTFGPGQKFTPYVGVITIFVTRLLQGLDPIIFGDGEQTRDFVHVYDIVSGTVATLYGPAGIYNLGTGRGTTINQIAKLLIDRINPDAEPIYAPEQMGELRFSVGDISAASMNLKYRPKHDLETDIDSVIAYIRATLDRNPR